MSTVQDWCAMCRTSRASPVSTIARGSEPEGVFQVMLWPCKRFAAPHRRKDASTTPRRLLATRRDGAGKTLQSVPPKRPPDWLRRHVNRSGGLLNVSTEQVALSRRESQLTYRYQGAWSAFTAERALFECSPPQVTITA